MRKNLIAVAAVAVLIAATATTAFAQQRPRGGMGGGRAGVSANIGGGPRANFNRPSGGNFARANIGRPGNFGPNRTFAAAGWNRPGWNAGWNRPGWNAGWNTGWNRPGWNTGWNRGWVRRPGFGWGTTVAFAGGPLYDVAGGGCWQRRLVPTAFGPRWRMVNVCGW